MTAEQYMRSALELFSADPPDDDYQRGYHEALKVFANEALAFKWDDPLLWGKVDPAPEVRQKPKFAVIDGGKE